MKTITINLPEETAAKLDWLVGDAGNFLEWNRLHPDDPANASDVIGALIEMLYKNIQAQQTDRVTGMYVPITLERLM